MSLGEIYDSVKAIEQIYYKGLNDQTLAEIYAGQYDDTSCMTGAKTEQDTIYIFNEGRHDENKSRAIVHDRIIKILNEIMQTCTQAIIDVKDGRKMKEIKDEEDEDALEAIALANTIKKWANTGKNEAKITKFMTSIGYQSKYRHVQDEFNASDIIIALPNGSLIIDRNMPICQRVRYDQAMRPDALSTQVIAVPYEAGAVNKDFDDYLKEAVAYKIDGSRHDDKTIQEQYNALIMYLGYCMIRGNPDQILMLWIGKGGSGRSTIAEIMTKTLGEYAKKGRKEMLIKNESGRIISDTALLAPKHFIYADEFNYNDVIDGAVIRSMTDEELFVEKKGKDPYTAKVNFTPLIISNYELRIEGYDNSIARRIFVMRFYREVKDNDVIVKMSDKIFNAGPAGILNTLIKGLSMYLDADNFKSLIPQYTKDLTKEFLDCNDPMQEFLTNYVEKTKNRDDLVKLTEMDKEITTFYAARSEDKPYKLLRSLATMLKNRQYDVYTGHGGASYVRGLKLTPVSVIDDKVAVAVEKAKAKEQSILGKLGELDNWILESTTNRAKQLHEIVNGANGFDENTIDKRIQQLKTNGLLMQNIDGSYIRVTN